MTDYARQESYEVRFEWGLVGLRTVAMDDPVAVVVDVLSFSTAVSVALSRKAVVLPFVWRDDRAAEYARRHDALLAASRGSSTYSLSPASLRALPPQTRIVLPSPNGSTICFEAPCSVVFAAQFHLPDTILRCTSGTELVQAGFATDISLAAELDVDDQASILCGGAFVPQSPA
jgi:phosphosulfolactate phosphohydrolase-like enzyme